MSTSVTLRFGVSSILEDIWRVAFDLIQPSRQESLPATVVQFHPGNQ